MAQKLGARYWAELELEIADNFKTERPPPKALPTGLRALVADDNDTSRNVVRRYLEHRAVQCVCVVNGDAAFHALKRAFESGNPFDIVITDLVMPVTSGLELSRLIRDDAALSGTPVILLSAAEHTPDLADAAPGLIGACLTKPIHRSRLYRQISNTLKPQETPDRDTKNATDSDRAADGFRGRVLVAEDNEVNQIVAEESLLSLGCAVDLAANGREAVEAVRAREYDLVFMDCQMPEMDGFEAVSVIRSDETGGKPRLPIIALTAHATADDRAKSLAAGMDDHLSKPFKPDELASVLRKWLPQQNLTGNGANDMASNTSKETAPEAAAILDLAVVTPLRAGNPDLWARLVSAYLDTVRQNEPELERGVAETDFGAVRMSAHILKSASSNLGAMALSQACRELEAAANAGETERMRIAYDDVCGCLNAVLPMMLAQQSEMDAPSLERPS